ncbi:flippase [Methanohalophilus sp. RSK]|uniref:flippase n=1 Tax=Methanohalophilus sp. RSK TaxID=2485783 RepID=UPI000F43BF6C|nr:flippase [Methanohalophilus sp. RSK]RNI15803.1 flippase [Methanohalophilus sp. RSK]
MPLKNILSNILSIEEVKRQSIANFFSQIVLTFVGFLSTMYFAHKLGSSVLGSYFLFTSYFGIINLFSDGGFGGAAIKRISEGEEQDAYFTAFIVTRTFFAVLIIAIILAFESYFQIEGQIINWLILAIIMSLFYSITSGGIAGQSKMGIAAVGTTTQNLSRIFIQVIAVLFGYGIGGLVGGFIAGFVIATLIQFKFLDLKCVSFEWRHVVNLMSFSFWLFLTSAGIILYSNVDVVMIGYFLEEADVGVYKVVFQFTTIAILMVSAIRTTLWPKVSRWGKIDDTESIEKSLSRGLTFSLLFAVPIIAGGILLGERMLYFFYGAGFAWGYTTLILLFFAQLTNVFQSLFVMFLGALDHQREAFYATAVSCIANVALNVILIPLMGIEGAAIATIVTMALNSILAMHILSNIINVRIDTGSTLNILKATAAMLLFVGFYSYVVTITNVWLTLIPVAIGAMVYGLLILRLDPGIYRDLKDISNRLNLPWPSML